MIGLLIMFIIFGAFAALSVRYGVDSRTDSDRSAALRVSGRNQLIGGFGRHSAAGVSATTAEPSAPLRRGRARSPRHAGP